MPTHAVVMIVVTTAVMIATAGMEILSGAPAGATVKAAVGRTHRRATRAPCALSRTS